MDRLNRLAEQFAPLLAAADVLFAFLIGLGLFFVGWRANGIARSNLILAKERSKDRGWAIKSDERATFKDNYEKISKALGIIMREGTVDREAYSLCWQARDDARLELPKEISDYTQSLFEKISSVYRIEIYINTSENISEAKRTEIMNKNFKTMNELIKEKPYEVYSKYIKYKDPTE